MKLFTSDILTLNRASPAKSGKRFVSFFIDLILITIFTFLFSLISNNIAINSSKYKAADDVIDAEIDYYQDYIEETNLVSYVKDKDGNFIKEKGHRVAVDSDVYVLENAWKAIKRSYSKLATEGDIQYPGFDNVLVDEAGKDYPVGSVENDIVSYFYTQYVPSNITEVNENGKKVEYDYGTFTPTYKNALVYSEAYEENFTNLFVFNKESVEEDNIPTLKVPVAYSMYCYLADIEGKASESGKNYYSNFYTGYQKMVEGGKDLALKAEPYFTDHLMVYQDAFASASNCLNVSALISVSLATLLVLILPKFMFADGVTIGRLATKTGMICKDKTKYKWYHIVISSICAIVEFAFAIFIIYLFPPYNGVYDTMVIRFIGTMPLFILLMIFFGLTIINGVFSLFTHYRTTLFEIITGTRLVDKTHLDEGDRDDQYEGKGN